MHDELVVAAATSVTAGVCVCVRYLDLQAERCSVRLSWKFKHVPQPFVLEIPAATGKHEEAGSNQRCCVHSLGHWVRLLQRLLVHQRPDD